MTEPAPERALAAIARELGARGRRFALVGGLAVSVHAEVRFTRDVDLAVVVTDDADTEQLAGFIPVAAAEELVAMKVLSMTEVRLQDRLDAQRLLQLVPDLD